MNRKLIFKIVFLLLCLGIVISAMRCSSSLEFKEQIQQIFSSPIQRMKWCPDHVVDFQWQDTNEVINTKFAKMNSAELKNIFCVMPMEPTSDSDKNISFKPLLKVQSAEAKTAYLEWNPEAKVFRVQGIVFRSSAISQHLLH